MGGCGCSQAGGRQQAAGSCAVRSCLTQCHVVYNEANGQGFWGHCSHIIARLPKLAFSLLRSVTLCRCNFLAGYVVPRHELAFSQPTEQGRSFAAAYTGSQKLLVYH